MGSGWGCRLLVDHTGGLGRAVFWKAWRGRSGRAESTVPGLAWLSQEGPLGPTCALSVRGRQLFALLRHLGAPICHVARRPQKLTLKYSRPHFPAPTGGGQGRKRRAAETQLRLS